MNKKMTAFILTLVFSIFIVNMTVTNGNIFIAKVGEVRDFSITNSVAKMIFSANGKVISAGVWDTYDPIICNDGSGGAIIVWLDYRTGTFYNLYAQKINSTGSIQWATDGVAICTIENFKGDPQICSDGSGGAIIIWRDYRSGSNYDIYAQKIDSTGSVQWGNGTPGDFNGTIICNANYNQQNPRICNVGSGAAVIVWEDYRNGTYSDIYAQKINSTGYVQWTANGTAICTADHHQYYPELCSDGTGGAIITWGDRSSGSWDIAAQRINSSGNIQWTANGTPICTAYSSQSSPEICSDGAEGAIITWLDDRIPSNRNLYAQKINSTGSVQWTANGTPICMASDSQFKVQICSDGAEGAIITWCDNRNDNYDIYAQKINSTGSVQWTIDGVALCTAINNQDNPQICSDDAGGAIITWNDYRSGTNYDTYAQKINSSNVQWGVDGTAICKLNSDQDRAQICSDGSGGAFITWHDNRNSNYDIYVQKVVEGQREAPETGFLLLLIAEMSTNEPFLGLIIGIIIGIAAAVVIVIVLIKKRSQSLK